MLRELRIRHFTIIDELSVTLQDGFTALTGETGAGKSIIVDAIGLILGEKTSPELVKTGEQEASVEAFFDLTSHPLLDDLAIPSGDGIIVRRSFSRSGRGRAYVNDTPVSAQTLSAVGRSLVTIHGQHEHQGLLRKENHLLYLDTLGGTLDDARSVQQLYQETADLRGMISDMEERSLERSQRISFIQFQRDEIDAAQLKEGEKEALEQEREILVNLSRLKEAAEGAYSSLYSAEGSCMDVLSRIIQQARDIARIDQSAAEVLSLLESSVPLLDDAAALLRSCKERYDLDPQKLEAVDERLSLLKRLEKKYGGGIEEILRYRASIETELAQLDGMDEQIGSLSAELSAKESSLQALSDDLSRARDRAARLIEGKVTEELTRLGFSKASFVIDIKRRESVNIHGFDDVEFLFSANPGEPPKPLTKVASGGELSRIMLALRCVELQGGTVHRGGEDGGHQWGRPVSALSPATLIFDEVDAGIGGVTAHHVGNRLKAVSAGRQVLCITHLSQIAALADHHLRVVKHVKAEGVTVAVDSLSDDARLREVAKMLSGKITEGSLRHARELLGMSLQSL